MLSFVESSAPAQPARASTRTRARRGLAAPLGLLLGVVAAALFAAPLAQAQDWGDDSSEDWSAQPAAPRSESASGGRASSGSMLSGWSFQTGLGFTADPETFLLNFEAPYAFNEWFSFGPAIQVGIDDNRTIVAPTGNLRLTIPDLPGRDFDRVHPYAIAGMGFAVIDPSGKDSQTGFLIDFGAGVEYQVSEKVFVGTQMNFNVLPNEVSDEKFFFAWQVGGIRFAF